METVLIPIVFQSIFTLLLIRFFIKEEINIPYLDIILGVLMVHLIYKAVLLSVFNGGVQYEKLHGAFSLLYGPLLYQYFQNKHISKNKKIIISRNDLWHYVPFLLVFMVNAYVLYAVYALDKLVLLDHYHLVVFIVTALSGFLYATYILTSKTFASKIDLHKKRIIIGIACLLYIPGVLGLSHSLWPQMPGRIIWYLAICLLLVFILIERARAQKRALSLLQEALRAEKQRQMEAQRKVYAHSKLGDSERKAISGKLTDIVIREKPYLNAQLTLEELAKMIDIPKHHLTEILNVDLNTNFYHYINGLRIKEAMRLMRNGQFDGNLLHVCFASGFKSKSTFNKYFKELTGTTPKAFRERETLTEG